MTGPALDLDTWNDANRRARDVYRERLTPAAELDRIHGDETTDALLHVLEQMTAALVGFTEAEADTHVMRCAGCGDWAWDEQPCPTCTALLRARRRRKHDPEHSSARAGAPSGGRWLGPRNHADSLWKATSSAGA